MTQNIGSEAPADPATLAFEALRREVALLNVAMAGLAAQRASTPDYGETLAEIAKGVSLTVGRLGKLLTSPVLATSPAEMARQIEAAGDEARRQDQAALLDARAALGKATGDLGAWIASARLASAQNRCLAWAALTGLAVGVALGAWAPDRLAQSAPQIWAWPERRAAHALDRDMWSAGERLLLIADEERWNVLQSCKTDQRADRATPRRQHTTSPHLNR